MRKHGGKWRRGSFFAVRRVGWLVYLAVDIDGSVAPISERNVQHRPLFRAVDDAS